MDVETGQKIGEQNFDNQQLFFIFNDPFLKPNSVTIKTLIESLYPYSHP